MEYKLSNYQENIMNYIRNETGNLLVNAKAGSGKTYTLIKIADELTKDNKKCLFLSFSKDIVNTLKFKLDNPNCQVKTVHSLGLTFIRSYLWKKHNKNYDLRIEEDKCLEIIKMFFGQICMEQFIFENGQDMSKEDLNELLYGIYEELVKVANFDRLYNLNYHQPYSYYKILRDVMSLSCLKLQSEEMQKNFILVIEHTIDEIKRRFEEPEINELTHMPIYIIDYLDMVYFPLYYRMRIPYSMKDYLDYILVDESQDLSVLQQLFIKQLVATPSTRYIFVGDEKQAIYGFAGADTKSIENIKNNFHLKELPLNICYRCPEKVLRVAQTLVPEIEWNKEREDKGIVECIPYEGFEEKLRPGDTILIRKNKDILFLFKTLMIDKKIQVKFKSDKLVKQIINEIMGTVKTYITRYNKFENIEKELYTWCEENNIPVNKGERTTQQKEQVDLKAKELIYKNKMENSNKEISKQNQTINYLRTCMQEFKEKGEYDYLSDDDSALKHYFDIILTFLDLFESTVNAYTLKTFFSHLSRFLNSNEDNNVPMLSSVHMMKGGECDRIFIYDYPQFPYILEGQTYDQKQQEKNLQYVALTRAKKELYLIDTYNPKNEDLISKRINESRQLVKEVLEVNKNK